ncbi:hypothetical protein KCP75_17510 [Salmonella enterica subsp. enterica]|nr:hypothetical protein KCP75_17510 [Salmonella enterica subsp. enterica]
MNCLIKSVVFAITVTWDCVIQRHAQRLLPGIAGQRTVVHASLGRPAGFLCHRNSGCLGIESGANEK